jgi:tRNA G18 (ribose-2'-O)-methylase SpoU
VPVGPHPQPWPDDPRLDPELLASGDARNVLDRYRYWTKAAIVADLATRRSGLHVAIENVEHDLNIGSIVRTANAFNVSGVHIVGRRRWNRRGAMVTEAYLDVHHHPDVEDLARWADASALPILAVDVVPGARPIEAFALPSACILMFGQEGPGLSRGALDAASDILAISQFGSTRSLNVAAAAAIAMHSWVEQHMGLRRPLGG